ncbi:MAG: hypothetical protein JJE22_16160 [Bacteroidia bacterium]|nr:hypothetical protein [Bacteroidia bacterium]
MLQFRIRYLLLSSCLFVFIGCSPFYRQMQPSAGNVSGLAKFKPAFTVALYTAQVDVVGNHLSGLLLIKKMPDSSIRMVFSNEMGFKFFDFEFTPDGNFKVYSVIKQMNKKPVLTTLRKDFELILMQRLDSTAASVRTSNRLLYYVFPQAKGYNYYITDSTGEMLVRMERASKRKTVVEAVMKDYTNGIPDTIGISHKTFNFTIGLKRIQQ